MNILKNLLLLILSEWIFWDQWDIIFYHSLLLMELGLCWYHYVVRVLLILCSTYPTTCLCWTIWQHRFIRIHYRLWSRNNSSMIFFTPFSMEWNIFCLACSAKWRQQIAFLYKQSNMKVTVQLHTTFLLLALCLIESSRCSATKIIFFCKRDETKLLL